MKRPLLASMFFLLLANTAVAIEFAGDSICVGVAQAYGVKGYAVVGAPTRAVPAQLRNIPRKAVVVVCAGTNDAANHLHGFDAAISAVLTEARYRQQRIIWVGPMPTSLWWDRYSDQADTLLSLRVPEYVSLRSIRWETRELARGNFHPTAEGYKRIANIIRGKL